MITLEDLEDMDPEDLMPCGECGVCREYLDHRDLVICDRCKGSVHHECCVEHFVCANCGKTESEEEEEG